MKDLVFVFSGIVLTILCWGTYGPVLHRGQEGFGGERLKPLMCVGAAYFIVGILVPLALLLVSGKLSGDWTFKGISWSMLAGGAGAVGALGVVLSLSSGGKPIFVMPLVFGGAPIVNVLVSMYFQGISWKDMGARFPAFLSGVIMVAVGASMVLIFAPRAPKAPETEPRAAATAPVEPAADQALADLPSPEPDAPQDSDQTT